MYSTRENNDLPSTATVVANSVFVTDQDVARTINLISLPVVVASKEPTLDSSDFVVVDIRVKNRKSNYLSSVKAERSSSR